MIRPSAIRLAPLWAAAILLLAGCQSAGNAGAENADKGAAMHDRRVVEDLTAQHVQRCFTDEGFTDVSIDEDGAVAARMNGYEIVALVQENDYPVLRFYFAIAGTDATLAELDEWNRARFFTKTYMDDEGDPVLEMTVNLEGGVTLANIRHTVRRYSQAHLAFLRDIAA